MCEISQTSTLKNIGAMCIIGLNGKSKKYKIEYTKSCQSQVIKIHKTQGQNIDIHLYKYCNRSDFMKMCEILKEYRCGLIPNMYWYDIELNDLFDKFLEYFEPNMFLLNPPSALDSINPP
jgi:hypothetical protein